MDGEGIQATYLLAILKSYLGWGNQVEMNCIQVKLSVFLGVTSCNETYIIEVHVERLLNQRYSRGRKLCHSVLQSKCDISWPKMVQKVRRLDTFVF